jgi:hypothetical protein
MFDTVWGVPNNGGPVRLGRRTCRPKFAGALRWAALGLCVCASPVLAAQAREGVPEGLAAGRSLGVTLAPSDLDLLPARTSGSTATPFVVRLVARWSEIESTPGIYDWAILDDAVSRVAALGHEPVLCLTGGNALYGAEGEAPLDGASLEAWIRFVRDAWRVFGGRVAVYQIWEAPDRGALADGSPAIDPQVYAFFLKSSALALRAEARADDLEVRIAQGDVDASRIEWQRAVWDADSAPYVDVLPVRLSAGGDGTTGDLLADVFVESLGHPPAPELWAVVDPGPADESAAAAARALASAARVGLVRVEDAVRDEELMRWAVGLDDIFAGGFGPAPLGGMKIEGGDGEELPGGMVGHFLSDRTFEDLVVLDLGSLGEGDEARLVVPSDARDLRFLDPLTGWSTPLTTSKVQGGREVRVPARPFPVAVSFRRPTSAPGFDIPAEELEVARSRGLTAQEIIARYQEVQKEQDGRLERLMARGRVEFHYRLSQAGAGVDVAIESNYFWERGGELEWEQTDYYINGNHARWKKFPKLPLIQPEKVITVPLDLTLDRTYTYRLEGEGKVEERPAYILSFEPTDPDVTRSLYRGRVWIDMETFVRLKVSVVQTNLEAPVLSNEENDFYEPVVGPGGETYWLLGKVGGQQLWTVAGRSFVVERELVFTSYDINPDPELFRSRRAAAYASDNQMLRDTQQGFRYLDRQSDGTRVVKDKIESSQLFVAAGAFKDNSVDSVLPLAGVNYFNYDLWGKGLQTEVFFAGAFAFANLTDPEILGGRMDAALETTLTLFEGSDKVYAGDDEVVAERIETRDEEISGRVGFPLGDFLKLNLVADLTWVSYSEDKDGKDARQALGLGFVLPPDDTVLTGTVQMTYDRKGYSTLAQGSWSSRSQWSDWGLTDPSGQILNPDYDPSQKNFFHWRIGASKEWFLAKFQKIRGSVSYLDGSDMDRFSRYQFSFFGGTRLNGFAGSGVRFDNGAIVRAGYSFNVFDVIQLNATVERARVEDRSTVVGAQDFTGLGLSGNLVGPWKTVIALSYGRALDSDVADLEGQQEFLLTVFKLF